MVGAMGILRATVSTSSLVAFLFSEQPHNRAWSHSTTTNVSGGAMVRVCYYIFQSIFSLYFKSIFSVKVSLN